MKRNTLEKHKSTQSNYLSSLSILLLILLLMLMLLLDFSASEALPQWRRWRGVGEEELNWNSVDLNWSGVGEDGKRFGRMRHKERRVWGRERK